VLNASEIMIKPITALLWLYLAIGNVQAAGNVPVETPRQLASSAVAHPSGETTLPVATWLLLIIGMGSLGAAAQRRRIQA
jgi:hypothetical protein